MTVRDQPGLTTDEVGSALNRDERWRLVQRIIESGGFERASQLRKILLYVSRYAILEPDRIVREYDIACEVLDRRKDFDPSSDNIVRSQFSNLRRKLELYFAEQGAGETLIVKIPKGSYLPVFVSARERHQETPRQPAPAIPAEAEEEAVLPVPENRDRGPWTGRESLLIGVCLLPAIVLGSFLVLNRDSRSPSRDSANTADNAFVRLMAQWEGDTTVIVPDTSLVLLENNLNINNVPLSEYAGGEYPARQLAEVKDPKMREMFATAARMRNTTFNEAVIASDFVATMKRTGRSARSRYARDLHVSDLNDGNTVVIGGAGSDPWVSLFSSKMNFRFIDDHLRSQYYFLNTKPSPGEQVVYNVTYADHGGDAVGYVDVGLTQNPSHTGYVLLIAASDEQEAESAANLLLRGKLPPEIDALLSRKNLRYFELFLRGKHIAGQADDSLELVSYRPL